MKLTLTDSPVARGVDSLSFTSDFAQTADCS